MSLSQRLLLVTRVLMESAIVAALAYWGYDLGGSTAGSLVLAITFAGLAFGFWGLVDFRNAGRFAEPLRLVQELAISLLAASALYVADATDLALALAGLSIAYHAFVYAAGERLLDPDRPASQRTNTVGDASSGL